MNDYISREAVNQVVLNRINANSKCLNGAKKDKLFEEEKYFMALLLEDGQIKSLVEDIPSADILEHARVIKEYCKKNLKTPHFWCEGCPLYKVMCQPVLSVPSMWNLPEGEKE